MLAGNSIRTGELLVAIAQREGRVVDGRELELILLALVFSGKGGADFEAVRPHQQDCLGWIANPNEVRVRQSSRECLQNFAIGYRTDRLGRLRRAARYWA